MSCDRVLPKALPADDPVHATYHLQLDPLPRLVGQARDFVLEHAPDLPPATKDVLRLLTSELVTNAVLHARTRLEVGMTVTQRSVVVTVHDLDLTRSAQQPYPAREGGWGLGLVSALSEQYAMEVHVEGGKTAWFRLPRGEMPDVSDDAAERPAARVIAGDGGTP